MITEQDKLQRARAYLLQLSEGIDPLSQLPLPADTVLRQERLSRCFQYTAGILEQVIENGGQVGHRSKARLQPFFLPQAQREQVELSPEPIPISALADRLNRPIDQEQMKKLTAPTITSWLVHMKYLREVVLGDGSRSKTATAAGEQLGISRVEKASPYGKTYFTNLYDRKAQQFLLDNLDAILAYKQQQKDAVPVPPPAE